MGKGSSRTTCGERGYRARGNSSNDEAIAELKNEGAIPEELEHCQAKYLNNCLQGDDGKFKR
jgi:transposase-like protein